MPRFYFDVRDGGDYIPDSQGVELESLAVAMQEALRAAGEICHNKLKKGKIGEASGVVIEIRNHLNEPACTMTTSVKIEVHGPTPP